MLANVDPSADAGIPSWGEMDFAMTAVKTVVEGLVEFVQSHSCKRGGGGVGGGGAFSSGGGSSPLTTSTNSITDSVIQGLTGIGGAATLDYNRAMPNANRYKTSLCRDWAQRGELCLGNEVGFPYEA